MPKLISKESIAEAEQIINKIIENKEAKKNRAEALRNIQEEQMIQEQLASKREYEEKMKVLRIKERAKKKKEAEKKAIEQQKAINSFNKTIKEIIKSIASSKKIKIELIENIIKALYRNISCEKNTPNYKRIAIINLLTRNDIIFQLYIDLHITSSKYEEIDYSVYPEYETKMSFYQHKKDINEFVSAINKLCDSGKIVLALKKLINGMDIIINSSYEDNDNIYINIIKENELINVINKRNADKYYYCKSNLIDFMGSKQILDLCIKMLMLFDKYDLLANYYEKEPSLSSNLEFMQILIDYYISCKDAEKAEQILRFVVKAEPHHHCIPEVTEKIKKLKLVSKLTSNNIDVEGISNLSGVEFEELIEQHFTALNLIVKTTPTVGDFGADLIVETKDNTRFVIQCKRFKNKLNLKAVQEVTGALSHYGGDIGIVITNSGFLPSAALLAESNGIELWDNTKLMLFLSGDVSFSQIGEFI